MNWQKTYSNLKPYEVVIKWRAPNNNDVLDLPAGIAKIQKRKWKIWYHVNDEFHPTAIINTYIRAWRTNKWLLLSQSSNTIPQQLPTPKVMIDRQWWVKIYTQENISLALETKVIVQTQDFSPEQLSRWVKLEFLYYRSGKNRTINDQWKKSRTWRSWYVHPAHTDMSLTAAYPNDWFRWWNHNWIIMERPSEFDVTSNWQIIPLWKALNSRLKKTECRYRDINGVEQTMIVYAPIRRVSNRYGNYLGIGFAHQPVYSPLYFKCRYSIRNEDGTWVAWPESTEYALRNTHNPFIYNTYESLNNFWEVRCTSNELFKDNMFTCQQANKKIPHKS